MWTNDVHADGVATALTELFAAEGLSAPSMRAIARQTHGAASSLVSRLGGKEAMLGRAAFCFVEQYVFQLRDRAAWAGWRGLLPRSDADRYWARGRMAWMELGQGNEGVAAAMAQLIGQELDAVRLTAEYPRLEAQLGAMDPSASAVTAAHALLVGLWERLLAPAETLDEPLEEAEALEIWVAHHGVLRETSERSRS